MKHPWRVWLLYALGLAVVVPSMAWLTWQVLALDRAEALARLEAEREELISRALWRMDTRIVPLLAEEAARPDFFYDAVIANPSKAEGKSTTAVPQQTLSPLLQSPPAHVLLHFRATPQGLLSPQCPSTPDRTIACANGIDTQQLEQFDRRQGELQKTLRRDDLWAELPDSDTPATGPVRMTEATAENGPALPRSNPEGVAAANSAPVIVPPFNPPPAGNSAYNLESAAERPLDQQQTSALGDSTGQRGSRAGNLPAGNNSSTSRRSQVRGGPYTQSADNPEKQQQVDVQQRGPTEFDNNDLAARNSNLQNFAQQAVANQKLLNRFSDYGTPPEVTPPQSLATRQEGPYRPIWQGDKLLFARRVTIGKEQVIQGCWLNWPHLEAALRDEVATLLPQFEFLPVYDTNTVALGRVLATLPVRIEVPPLDMPLAVWSPIRYALLAAWGGLALAAIAAAFTLQGIIALSERRAAFVAAVTHELRTPLTTFRMYAEMLAEGMVPDPAQQRKYLGTLRVESDRLAHLVENVLQYARLERGRPGKHRQQVALESVLDRVVPRLAERASQAGLTLELAGDDVAPEVVLATDPTAVEQILFNLVDNACKYAAAGEDKRLHLHWAATSSAVELRVSDHGPGIPPAGRKRLFSPFSKSVHEAAESAPGVGLGLALSRRLAQSLGGALTWEETPGGGATFCLRLRR